VAFLWLRRSTGLKLLLQRFRIEQRSNVYSEYGHRSSPRIPRMNLKPKNQGRRLLPHRARQAVLTAHIMMSVGLLGDAAGFLAVALRVTRTDNAAAVVELMKVLNMFSLVFGIPLSFGALLSGLTLGLGTKWGVFRYPWVTTKLLLIVSVMLVGGFIIGPAEDAMLARHGDATRQLIAGASYDVLALATATVLSVFKPGGPFRRAGEVASPSA
jgi:hypothetical protein